MHDLVVLLLRYARGTWRFRWWMLGIAWAVSVVGWSIVAKLPVSDPRLFAVTVEEPGGVVVSLKEHIVAGDVFQIVPSRTFSLPCAAPLATYRTLRALMEEVLAIEPRAQVEYVSVADALSLAELRRVEGPALFSMAVVFGTTRLIDNELVGMKE